MTQPRGFGQITVETRWKHLDLGNHSSCTDAGGDEKDPGDLYDSATWNNCFSLKTLEGINKDPRSS